MEASEQSALETQLNQVGDAAKAKIKKMASLQDGLLKDIETALERDFKSMRSVIRSLETLAEDQEEEQDESVLHRLQQYQRQYQELQTAYSNAKLVTKIDPHEENRRLLLAGADPTRRQRELQTEAEMVGAAQSTTGSLQRSRQVLVEQIDSTQTILASMDNSHEQLQKVTTEYQGQADVYGSSKRLLRTLKRHSSWDKLVLYGGATMFLLVCLYVVQKRSLYFVPTFVKTGLGKLVPTWSRSSSQEADQLVQPMKARGDDPGTDGFRQKPSPETLKNADQAEALLQRHAKKSQAAPELVDVKQAHATLPSDKDHQPVSGKDSSPAQAQQHTPPPTHEQLIHPKPGAGGQAVNPQQAPATNSVTDKQMQNSGYADAFAKIMEGIPDHMHDPSAKAADSDSVPQTDKSHSQPESLLADDARSSDVGAAVAAAMDKVAEQQQQQQAVSLDGGAAYPEHVAQVVSGEQGLSHHPALLHNDSVVVSHNATDSNLSASEQHLQGAMPDSTADLADSIKLQDSVSSAVHDVLNSTRDTAADKSAPLKLHAERHEGDSESSNQRTQESDELVESDSRIPYQSEADDFASAAQSERGHSVPQAGPAGSDDADLADQVSDRRLVSQQQMDESGHADAFAKIMESIPDHIQDAVNKGNVPADTEIPNLDRTDPASSGSGHSSGTQHHQHAEL